MPPVTALELEFLTPLFEGNVSGVKRFVLQHGLVPWLQAGVAQLIGRLPKELGESLSTLECVTIGDVIGAFERGRGSRSKIEIHCGREGRKAVGECLGRWMVALAWGEPLVVVEPTDAGAPLPLRPTAIMEWIEKNYLSAALEVPLLSVFGARLDRSTSALLGRMRPTPTVDTLLRDEGKGGRLSAALPARGLETLRSDVRGYLEARGQQTLGILAEERQRALRRGERLADPRLAPFAETLRQARAKIRQRFLPHADDPFAPLEIHFSLNPPVLRVRGARRVRGDSIDVRVPLETYPDEPLQLHCACCRPECNTLVSAIDVLLDWAYRPPATQVERELFDFLVVPRWHRMLALLDAGASRSVAARRAGEGSRLTFRLTLGDAPKLDPFHHKPLKSGGWSAGSRYSHARDGYSGADAEVIEKVFALAETTRYDYSGTSRRFAVYHSLELLAGSDKVYLAEDHSAPLSIRRGRIGVAVVPTADGGLMPVPSIEGDPTTAAEVAAQIGGRYFIVVNHDRRQCVLAELEDEARSFCSLLTHHKPVFPIEAAPELLQRLGAVERTLPLSLPPELEGERVEPDMRALLRLSPRPTGLAGEAMARPLAEGPVLVPGEGAQRISGFRDGRRVHTERDLDGERARSKSFVDGLPLAEAHRTGTLSFEIEGDDEALDLIAYLRGRDDVVVEWPAGATPRTVGGTATPAKLRVVVQDRRDWFGLDGEVDVDGDKVSLARLLGAVRDGRRYARVSGDRWLAISDELRERLAGAADVVFEGRSGLEVSPAGAAALSDLTDGVAEATISASFRRWIDRLTAAQISEPAIPTGLLAELRPYQLDGVRWLLRMSEWGVGCCLADDMGLGKTVQALAAILARAGAGPTLVIAPTSVCTNWLRETRRFAPSLNPIPFRDTDRGEAIARLGPNDLLIASYGLVVRHAEELAKKTFATLVVDEAQAIKNAATRRARAVRDLDADWRLALTGTPIENHLGELWSLMRTVAPGLLGSWEQFRERFAAPIERDKNPARRRSLARVVRPFILRRKKSEVAPELPSRTEIRHTVTLSTAERRLYDDTRIAAVAELSSPDRGPPEQKRFRVLAAITRLRQLACNPRLLHPESTTPSAKLAGFLELVDELRDGGHRALVFSQFTSHLALVRQALDERKVTYLYLDGQTPESGRTQRVDAFQRGEGDLFLISLKAGGTGLNLTAADYVVHLDPWWNPAVEDQATDRAHRIGQTRPVTVYRLVARGTIEEAILAMHEDKRDLVAGLLDGSDAAGRLSTDELVDLIRVGAATGDAEPDDPEEPGESTEERVEPPASSPGSASMGTATGAVKRVPSPTAPPPLASTQVTVPLAAAPQPVALPPPSLPSVKSEPAEAPVRSEATPLPPLDELIAGCKMALLKGRGARSSGTASMYGTILDRFAAHARASKSAPATIADLDLAAHAYWTGLQSGRIQGTKTAYLAARAALGRLTEFARRVRS